MAKNDFLAFATADGANVLSAEEYQKLTSRSNGFSAGVARSQELNTVWRQSSAMSAALGQFIADKTDKDVLDDGDIQALQAGFEAAVKAWGQANTPAASTTVAGITKLSSATNSNDETMAATPKAVKAAYDLASKVSVDGIYPVGIVTWFAQNKDPNTLFPGTTWKYIGENKTVRLASANGSDVMTTGGSDSVTLERVHIPAHTHMFSANTSTFDYGTKGTSGVGDHIHNAWTDTQGAHNHNFSFSYGAFRDRKVSIPNGGATDSGIEQLQTDVQGGHGHNVGIGGAGGHSHTVDIGAHSHSVSGTTGVSGAGAAFSVANAFIKLMGWYRSA